MQTISFIDKYFNARLTFFKWRYNLILLNKIILASSMACLTGFLAQIKIPLIFTPVPITGQTFAVLLAGVILGRYWGGLSQFVYIALGFAGIPWFTGWSGGISILIGPTGGYFIGFILAALFIGHFTDKYIWARGFLHMFGIMFFANFFLIHLFGLLQLWLWFHITTGKVLNLWQLFSMGTVPFVFGDTIKILAAALLAKAITPKKNYNT